MNSGFSPIRLSDDYSGCNIAIVKTLWNADVVDALAGEAQKELQARGADCELFAVPGAVELTYAAQRLVDSERFDAIIVCGCVVRGDTPHFDYVCQSVTQGITELNANGPVPVIFCVLTVNTHQQALDRCGGPAGNKGQEAAQTALAMIDFANDLD